MIIQDEPQGYQKGIFTHKSRTGSISKMEGHLFHNESFLSNRNKLNRRSSELIIIDNNHHKSQQLKKSVKRIPLQFNFSRKLVQHFLGDVKERYKSSYRKQNQIQRYNQRNSKNQAGYDLQKRVIYASVSRALQQTFLTQKIKLQQVPQQLPFNNKKLAYLKKGKLLKGKEKKQFNQKKIDNKYFEKTLSMRSIKPFDKYDQQFDSQFQQNYLKGSKFYPIRYRDIRQRTKTEEKTLEPINQKYQKNCDSSLFDKIERKRISENSKKYTITQNVRASSARQTNNIKILEESDRKSCLTAKNKIKNDNINEAKKYIQNDQIWKTNIQKYFLPKKLSIFVRRELMKEGKKIEIRKDGMMVGGIKYDCFNK